MSWEGPATWSTRVTVPQFASAPDITVTIYSNDDREDDGVPENDNPRTTFLAWAIEYRPLEGRGGKDRIVISATNTAVGVEPGTGLLQLPGSRRSSPAGPGTPDGSESRVALPALTKRARAGEVRW